MEKSSVFYAEQVDVHRLLASLLAILQTASRETCLSIYRLICQKPPIVQHDVFGFNQKFTREETVG